MADDRATRERYELMEVQRAPQVGAVGRFGSKLGKMSRELYRGLRARGKGNGK